MPSHPARGLDKGVEKQDPITGRRLTTAFGALVTATHRGATILAELVGYASNCDAAHVTQPQKATM